MACWRKEEEVIADSTMVDDDCNRLELFAITGAKPGATPADAAKPQTSQEKSKPQDKPQTSQDKSENTSSFI